MIGNIGPSTSKKLVKATRSKIFEVFDNLPKELRDAINYAPYKYSPIDLYNKYISKGYTVASAIKAMEISNEILREKDQ